MFHSSSLIKSFSWACLSVILAFPLLAIGGCENDQNLAKKSAYSHGGGQVGAVGKIRIVARVSKYLSDGYYDDYADGSSFVYDLSVVEVIEPKKYKGMKLRVLHDAPVLPGSVWLGAGNVLSFMLDEDLIKEKGVVINAASLAVLQEGQ